jgi:hypothetical protein
MFSDVSAIPGAKYGSGVVVRKGGGQAEFVLAVIQEMQKQGLLQKAFEENGLQTPPTPDQIGINLTTKVYLKAEQSS